MAQITDKNYLVIASWMITQLKLKGTELIIYACIYGFSQNGDGYNGSLNYLMSWTGSSKNTVLNTLKSLEGKNLISKTEIFKNNVKFCEYHANLDLLFNSCDGGAKIEPNNIYIDSNINNNISNNNNNYKDDIDNIIKYLNIILGSKFALGTQKTRNQIIKWLKLGYSVDDFKDVIEKKYKEWNGTEWEKYLRPETLFGSKFEGYVNQKRTNNSFATKNNKQDAYNELILSIKNQEETNE